MGADSRARLRRGVAGGAAALLLLAVAGAARADIAVQEGAQFSGHVVNVGGGALSNATITWGGGTPNSPGTADGAYVSGTHTYAQSGTYAGSVSYTCLNLSGVHTASFSASIGDAALTSDGRDGSGTAGKALHLLAAHFQDANPLAVAADFTAQ